MHTKGPLGTPVTSRSVVGGATWGLRNGFDVAPRGARAPHARPRARPFPVTARFGHPLLENRFPPHLFGMLSLGGVRRRYSKLPASHPVLVRFLDKSKIWLELRVGVASAYHRDSYRHRTVLKFIHESNSFASFESESLILENLSLRDPLMTRHMPLSRSQIPPTRQVYVAVITALKVAPQHPAP